MAQISLEHLLRSARRALVIGVGGGGDVVGALVTARFLEFCGLEFRLGGLSWERSVYDPIPGPRSLDEVENVRSLHRRAWLANAETKTNTGVYFAESRMAAAGMGNDRLEQRVLIERAHDRRDRVHQLDMLSVHIVGEQTLRIGSKLEEPAVKQTRKFAAHRPKRVE